MKSDTCFSKTTGQPLSVYDNEYDAISAAEHSELFYDKEMFPYFCDVCSNWHLTPKSRYTPSSECPVCVGSDGRPKQSYRNEKEARLRAEILCDEQGLQLSVYECEMGYGWHLTKR
ncbi:hypothetical protein [Endozoicomonas euniceicola]|uniref:Regulatory protein FmdB Zinc ribbon domain-containing protein n=1 Tax=Endozoicomonas euniceicola TaxID=1234143 RepID=A0ABY6GRV0_9GAMM|nr:hypothetical protein [Endozoicomonas euniceicola]UYM15471.1 hypothetical protein NX720_21885 [Endozoicomonas euniceicola]